jgi:outer membrane protein
MKLLKSIAFRPGQFAMIAAVACALVTLLATVSAAGGEGTISVREAVSLALKGNHDLRAYAYEIGARGEDVGIALSTLLPHLSFEERFMRTNNPPSVFSAKLNQQRFTQQDFSIDALNQPRPINDFQTSLMLEQTIFSRKAMIGLDMSKVEREAREGEYSRKKEEIAFQVIRVFLSLQTARQYVVAAGRAVEDAQEHRRIAQLRYNSGLGLYADVLRASTALAEADQKFVTGQTNLSVARRSLGLLLGQSGSLDASDEAVELPRREMDAYLLNAASRNDLKAAGLYFENAKKNVSLAEAGYLPTVGVGGGYQFNDHRKPFGAEGQSWTVQAFLRWQLFDGFRREHERAKAKYQVSQAEEQFAAQKSAVSFKVYEAGLAVEEAHKNQELAASALGSAEEGKRLIELRYRNSLAPIVDLLDAQANLDHARAAHIARANDYRLARVNLSYQSGSLLGDLAIEQ